MKKLQAVLATLSIVTACTGAHATEIYTGLGTSGLMLGMSHTLSPSLVVRGDVMAGLNLDRNGTREGVNYDGYLRSNRVGGFMDWFPFANGGFRMTGGLTLNQIKIGLNSSGNNASATINGKPVNLTGETFNAELKFPQVTPYLGIGYGHQATKDTGFGFHMDIGVMVGRFDTKISTSLVGKQGITQADVDAAATSLRDSVSKLSVLPAASIGVSYRF